MKENDSEQLTDNRLREGENQLYKLAKQRITVRKIGLQFRATNDADTNMLTDEENAER